MLATTKYASAINSGYMCLHIFFKEFKQYAAGRFVTRIKMRHRNRNKAVRLKNLSLCTKAIIDNHRFVPGPPQLSYVSRHEETKLAPIFSDNSVHPRSFNRILSQLIAVFAGLTVKRPQFWKKQLTVVLFGISAP